MAGAALDFARVTDPNGAAMDALLAIYAAAIPAEERKPQAAVRAMAASPAHRVEVATDEQGAAGFSLTYVGRELSLLEYLAVDDARRGAGVGAALFRRAADAGSPLLLEVESDREDTPDRAVRARRIAFYRRLGCRRVEKLRFILPLAAAGAALRLDLLVAGVEMDAVPRAMLRRWLTEMYVGVYGCAADDPRIDAMLAGMPDPAALA